MSEKIPMNKIRVSDENVRRLRVENEIEELASSIISQGLLQPIIVVEASSFVGYEVIAGQRRYLAVKSLDWEYIDAIVKKSITPSELKIISLVENIQRKDIDPQDRSTAILTLISYGLSYDEVSERIGVSVASVRQWAGFDAIYPGIKQLVSEGGLNQSQALELFRAINDKSEDEAVNLAKTISTLPTSKKKDTAIRILKRDPDIGIPDLLNDVEDKSRSKALKITLTFSSSVSVVLKKKARKKGVIVEELVKEIVEDFIQE